MQRCLPQHDPRPGRRARALQRQRRRYRPTFTELGRFVTLAGLPLAELPALRWLLVGGWNFGGIFVNNVLVGLRQSPRQWPAQLRMLADRLRRTGARWLPGFIIWLAQGRAHGQPRSEDQLRGLFRVLRPAAQTQDGLNDELFAELRVSGPNPLQLCRWSGPAEELPAERVERALGRTVAEALDAGAVYACDYRVLEGLRAGHFPCQKHLAAPLALFGLPAGGRALVPVAISLRPGGWVGPEDGARWERARLAVQCADVHVHQAVHHLGHTHLLLGAVALATARELSSRHPLHGLLRAHFDGNLFINWLAKRSLVAPGGSVAALLAPPLDEVLAVTARSLQDIDLRELALPRELERRGVHDAGALPHYPYRDTGRRLWDCLAGFIDELLLHVYPDEQLITGDTELQAWVGALEDPALGRMTGASEPGGGIHSRAALGDLLTTVIFRASVVHAALNFPQLGLMGNPEVFPLSLYGDPTEDGPALALLPELNQAHAQINLGQILGGLFYNPLGDYPRGCFTTPATQAVGERFRSRLRSLEAELRAAGDAYATLWPSRIPASTNI
jgi:arachidonate 15-lipoxygenase